MRRRPLVAGISLVVALVACSGDRPDLGVAPPSPAVAALGDCAPFDDLVAPPRQLDNLFVPANRAVNAHPDVLTAAFWDRTTNELVIRGTNAAALDRTRAELPVDAPVRTDVGRWSHSDLDASLDALRGTPGINVAMVTVDGRAEVDPEVRDEATRQRIRDVLGPVAVIACLRGGVAPADFVPYGPQPQRGDSWRLLSSGLGGSHTAAVAEATDPATLAEVWTDVEASGQPPEVDFGAEVVLAFSPRSSGCAPRLDGIVVDRATRAVRAWLRVPGGEHICTALLQVEHFVVAIGLDHLPDAPYTVQLSDGWGDPPVIP